MRIAIVGYGKMGKEIEALATQLKHTISFLIDLNNTKNIYKIDSTNTDVIIEFTRPDAVIKNMQIAFEKNIPFVTGTTGWNDQLKNVTELCNKFQGTLFYSSNFSIGVYLFMEFAKSVSSKMKEFKDYNVRIEETHHTQKLDTPSGTAISLAENILPFFPGHNSWKKTDEANIGDLPINSFRKENIVGTHNLIFESDCDLIELSHKAKNRQGFAQGAILAAEFISKKKGIFTMKDLIK